jgi:hypothetical protein
MREVIIPMAMICLAQIIFWFKGNSKIIYGLDWSPMRWWMTTSLLTNYLTLLGWWRLMEVTNVWKAGVYWGITGILVDLTLNTIYFGFNVRGAIALGLILVASLISHHA